jgi:hypothetical protein
LEIILMPGKPPRAEQAREVLDWCRHALQELQQQPTGMDWIVKWAGTLALLRTVGEALKNVDAQGNPAIRKGRQCWKKRVDFKNLPIYDKFIDGDVNRLLHQAEVTAGQSATVFAPSAVAKATAFGEDRTSTEGTAPPARAPIYEYRMNGGHFTGDDPRQVVQEAIDWWQQQIDDIQADAA